jgi:acyl carrier protein
MSSAPDTLKEDVKRAIVESLRLPISADEIENGMSLFSEGLGLDSIDVLELVLEMERRFGVSITDDETGQRVLRSVNTIADFIVSERARKAV